MRRSSDVHPARFSPAGWTPHLTSTSGEVPPVAGHLVPIIGNGRSLTTQLGANILTIDQSTIYDASGHAVSQATVQSLCSSGPSNIGNNVSNQCLAQHHFTTLLSYQPGNRIPDFHLILIGGYLGLGVIAAVLVWWLVRRTSLRAG